MGQNQIHDFNPGIEPNGLFWTAPIDPHDVLANPGAGRAVMDVNDLAMPDFHDLVNAVMLGPSVPGVVSFRVEWAKAKDKRRFHNEAQQYDGSMVITTARCEWRGETSEAIYVSDPASTSVTVVAEVGHMRNGVFF